MGAITSKANEVQNKKEHLAEVAVTPKHSKVLPFDPRSPSDYIDRTPIAINKTPDPDRNLNQSAALKAVTSQVLFDPRSPSTEVSRTPIVVDEDIPRKTIPLRPSRLAELQNTPSNFMSKIDPRSPTDKVPRTPIDERITDENSLTSTDKARSSEGGECVSSDKSTESKTPNDKGRHPLSVIQNENVPQASSVADTVQNLEEEFSKNENVILKKLGAENNVKSDTTFVETI